jgi:poly-gamma-glutamate capsule biosynthesis protein CapA/YwtB (metallophosphatase superfamily)
VGVRIRRDAVKHSPRAQGAFAAFVGLSAAACGAAQSPHLTETPEHGVTLVFGGDVLLGRWDGQALRSNPAPHEGGPHDERLRQADFAIVNLESPPCPSVAEVVDAPGVRLVALPESWTWLEAHGIDLATVANNHAADCGGWTPGQGDQAAADEATMSPEQRAALAVVAFHHWTVLRRADLSIGVLAVNTHHMVDRAVDAVPPARLADAVCAALAPRAGDVDVVVVSVHWGRESEAGVSIVEQAAAARLSDCGVDIVVGHGSHQPEGITWLGDTVVAWGLGNLRFDQRDPIRSSGRLLQVELEPAADGWRVARWHGIPVDAAAVFRGAR